MEGKTRLIDSLLSPPDPSAPGFATMWEGNFTYSGRDGSLTSVKPGGFFCGDTRFLSRLQLELSGLRLEILDAACLSANEVIFLFRTMPPMAPGHEDEGLVAVRRRVQSSVLREEISVENRTAHAEKIDLSIKAEADFVHIVDLLVMQTPRVEGHRTEAMDDAVRFAAVVDGVGVATEVRLRGAQAERDGRLRCCFVLAPGERRMFELEVVPVRGTRALGYPAGAGAPPRRVVEGRTRVRSSISALEHLWARSAADLRMLQLSAGGSRITAAGIPWFVRVFGRDSIIAALQAMALDRGLALGTARRLADLQGRDDRRSVGEEAGKIPHEVVGRVDGTSVAYYESVDVTPLFCILAGELHAWGTPPKELRELLPSVRAAAQWIDRRVRRDGLLFYEKGPRLPHQGWKDSEGAIVDARGRRAEPPLAVVEAQAYAVEGLRRAATLEEAFGEPWRAEAQRGLADDLQDRMEDCFWMEDVGTFAVAVDRVGARVETVCSNAGHVLWAGAASPRRAASVARSLLGDGLFTGWGIRTLSSAHTIGYSPASYHRGCVWPHDTMMCAEGLLRYGHRDQALEVALGLLAAAPNFAFRLPEVFCGFDRDTVARPVRFPTSCAPQAWAAAAGVGIVQRLLGLRPALHEGKLFVDPIVPEGSVVELCGAELGGGWLTMRAEGSRVTVLEAPEGVELVQATAPIGADRTDVL